MTTPHLFALQTLGQHVAGSWPWYVVRASGLLAVALLILLMISGIGHVTGWTFRIMEPVKAWAVHRALGLALCGVILVHCLTLLLDKFVSFNLADISIPFLSRYHNNSTIFGISFGGIAIASGILAAYGVVVIVLSSLNWIDTKKGAWKLLHYLSYVVMILAFIHGLSAGTDLAKGWLRGVALTILILLILAALSRMRRRVSTN